eukprot:GCRY01004767.1.p1 GENE.GCRY01004767.1~~GCRY01004767.1.p1  ORF type:complete len:750 (+),score=223.43 GCRY01004767.1:204-2453(+)
MRTLQPTEVNFEEKWASLEASFSRVIIVQSLDAEWMDIYRTVYQLCIAPTSHWQTLYKALEGFFENHVSIILKRIDETNGDILEAYSKNWVDYSIGSYSISQMCQYLNVNFILSSHYASFQPRKYEIRALAAKVWRDKLFQEIKSRLVKDILEAINKERRGEFVEPDFILNAVRSIIDLGLGVEKQQTQQPPANNISEEELPGREFYRKEFETFFLESTKTFYMNEVQRLLAFNNVAEYLAQTCELIKNERNRVLKYMDGETVPLVSNAVNEIMITKQQEYICSECEQYLQHTQVPHLSNMYTLLSKINAGVKPMLGYLHQHIKSVGEALLKAIPVEKHKDPRVYVEELLQLYARFHTLVKDAFNSDPEFIATLEKACGELINHRDRKDLPFHAPELIAKYTDLLLRRDKKTALLEKELDDKLNEIMILFRLLQNKDVFQKFYMNSLSRRLIHGASLSDDAEGSMITRLKEACGYEYTSKLQRMFTDISLSADINRDFSAFCDANGHNLKGIDFCIQVLTANTWPLPAPQSSFVFPPELLMCKEVFERFYYSEHQGRKLSWLNNHAKADVKLKYLSRPYEVSVTTYQMAVLLLFNETTEMTVENINENVKLSEKELMRTCQSLVDAKLFTATDTPLTAHSTLTLNMKFSSKRIKFNVSKVVQAESKEENKAALKSVEDDRQMWLSACVVRIMKSRKTMTHRDLVVEIMEQATNRFKPTMPTIKKCIEMLIDKEFMCRVEGTTNEYNYVA